jgi:toxin FitB
MFVLDTNVVAELRKVRSGKADSSVAAWADATDANVSATTMMESEIGVLRIERRDPMQGALLRAWMDHHVLPESVGRVLPVDTDVARRCSSLHLPDPRAVRDALVAATALLHGDGGRHAEFGRFQTDRREAAEPMGPLTAPRGRHAGDRSPPVRRRSVAYKI